MTNWNKLKRHLTTALDNPPPHTDKATIAQVLFLMATMEEATRIPEPQLTHDLSAPFTQATNKCGTCAYHSPLTLDEWEMERGIGRSDPHPCHERTNVLCKGSYDTQQKLEEETQ